MVIGTPDLFLNIHLDNATLKRDAAGNLLFK